ncbi:MAG TPA: hypothetical protein ENG63_05845 [Candidatus Desulfofervidus auxilii]|uniref:PEP-CTERM sorting domain-containing protein n=1 Tax=Desulfofervidus auxilii TaxID=1621989 RepID=A0A7C0U2N3_DESA2|nr:hypothetical protein [Candidatus Desulfofervidus auxilii]
MVIILTSLLILNFNQTDRSIKFTTTITAITDLTNLKFFRVIDPDQDYNDYETYTTYNYRGYDDTLPAKFYVYAVGPYSNWTIGLFSDLSLTHNTGISEWWSVDPDFYLNENNNGDGDNSIGIAFDLGDLNAGQSVTFGYAYVLGENPSVAASAMISIPGSVFLLGTGLLSLVRIKIKQEEVLIFNHHKKHRHL